MGFSVIGAGRCYLHQQHGSSCSGGINFGEHLLLTHHHLYLYSGSGRTFFKYSNNAMPCLDILDYVDPGNSENLNFRKALYSS